MCRDNSVLKSLIDELMRMVGTEIAKMHLAEIIHGDLTTSNMMLRRPTASQTGTSDFVCHTTPSYFMHPEGLHSF